MCFIILPHSNFLDKISLFSYHCSSEHMKQERVILSFIAVFIGLIVAGIAFYFYQSTKTVSTSKSERLENPTPTPTQNPSLFLQVFEPKDEQIVDRKTVTISGKTKPEATVVILTTSGEEIIEPSR